MYKLIEYLVGCFNFPIDEGMIIAALAGRGLEPSQVFAETTEKQRDLVLADILIMLSRSSMGYTQKTASDAFSMELRGELIPLADRQAMIREANAIYGKYEEEAGKVRPLSALNVYADEKDCKC